MTESEYRKRARRADMMLSAHSWLRDRYYWRANALTLAVITLSAAGLTLALANGDQNVKLLGLSGKLQVFAAVLAAATFVVGLTDLVVNWRERAWGHALAVDRLAGLKA